MLINMNRIIIFFFASIQIFNFSYGYPEKGKWIFEASNPFPKFMVVTKSMYSKGTVDVKFSCSNDCVLSLYWILQKTPCWKEHFEIPPVKYTADLFMENFRSSKFHNKTKNDYMIFNKIQSVCDITDRSLFQGDISHNKTGVSDKNIENPTKKKDAAVIQGPSQLSIPADGIYMLMLEVSTKENSSANITIKIDMKNSYGYLSAADYPLLPFYSIMCFVYFCYGVGWLTVSFMRWRELLRVQYWIGAVIFLGMLEKTIFTGVYESVNERGEYIPSLLYFAEIVSCLKRTLSRILVIIVAFGFGIVKPRLGNVLHRMVALGLLYFVIATIESCIRVMKVEHDYLKSVSEHKDTIALVPLALLETIIFWWVFSALVNTIRTLSLRRNSIKLQLYRHFKNTLMFSVFISVIFMTYCILYQNMNTCVEDWMQLWVNTAFWHVLFAFILLVIMILWRPTNNNQRFAFSPLLDEASEDEEENLVVADVSDTMKLRSNRSNSLSNSKDSRSLEDDLQWLDENIPTTMMDKGFPSADSDEEVIVTKFEISKMQ